MGPWIKVNGVTNAADARLAQAAGADAIGLVLVPGHPREVRLDEAAEIAAAVTIETVVVVHDTSPDLLRTVQLTVEPARIEVWNAPPPEDESMPWYRAQYLAGREALGFLKDYEPDRLLVHASRDLLAPDGRRFLKDKTLLSEMGRLKRIVLGGAVDLTNVASVVRQMRPWGLDVGEAVEGESELKEWDLLKPFIQRAREA